MGKTNELIERLNDMALTEELDRTCSNGGACQCEQGGDLGKYAALDLVFIGSALVLGGLIGWPFSTWPPVVVASGIICIVYVFIGRRYVKRWIQIKETRTNVEAIIGSRGMVLKGITRHDAGRVKVGGQEWRASADEDIAEGSEIVVNAIRGVTLIVSKNGGSKQ